ncbi:glycosyltransferase family 2 protein [Loigolactobacillus zhaoyuanensis]|uniref:glycosyltransferase family 2 protein n=1 Tax=Loigolactobacillus zhaoyuanensis TaxID=2486017 RepID=UPI000F73C859|nr:glycosyltransferase family A protein [Loigolactobacillus zhaoyuanensis]
MTTMKISVVVPTYNLGPYVNALLQNLAKQTVDFELWLVDDGSTDKTATQISQFVKGIPNFYAIQLEHNGVSVARNYGLSHATGAGIAFIDGDDLIAPTFVEALSQGLDQDAVMAAVGYEWYRRPITQADSFIELDQASMFDQVTQHGSEVGGYVWNKAFRAAAIKAVNLTFDESLHLAEDYLFTASFVAHTPGKYVYLPHVLYTKRNRPNSTLHMTDRSDRREENRVFDHIYDLRRFIE